MLKAVKKLRRLWTKKKRRRRIMYGEHHSYYYPPPPPPRPPPPPPPPSYHCCCSYQPASAYEPSAPPLPPWLQPEQTTAHETISAPLIKQSLPEFTFPSASQFTSTEIIIEPSPSYPSLPVNTTSYQQYLAPNPVYEVPPDIKVPKKQRSAWFLGCLVDFGVNLVRCFCPCFNIREVS